MTKNYERAQTQGKIKQDRSLQLFEKEQHRNRDRKSRRRCNRSNRYISCHFKYYDPHDADRTRDDPVHSEKTAQASSNAFPAFKSKPNWIAMPEYRKNSSCRGAEINKRGIRLTSFGDDHSY